MNKVTSIANIDSFCLDSPLLPTSSDIRILSNCTNNINQIANNAPRNQTRVFPFITQSPRTRNLSFSNSSQDFPPSTPPPHT